MESDLVVRNSGEGGQVRFRRNNSACSGHLSIESAVERPNLYIFARSKTSFHDQMLYTPTRVNDLAALRPSATSDGISYESVQRIGIGKLITNMAVVKKKCISMYFRVNY